MRRVLALSSAPALSVLLLWSCVQRRTPVLYLVPIHAAPELLSSLSNYYREQMGLDVRLLGAVQADSPAFDQSRRQLIAEELVSILRDRHRPDEPSATVIGVTSWDMYIRDRPWQFGFSWREPPYAVVSYARMTPARLGEAPGDDRLLRRLRKMVSRNIGIMLFGVGTNADRTSLMYQDIMGVDDLDRIDEDLTRAGFPVAAAGS